MRNKKSTENVCMVTPSSNSNSLHTPLHNAPKVQRCIVQRCIVYQGADSCNNIQDVIREDPHAPVGMCCLIHKVNVKGDAEQVQMLQEKWTLHQISPSFVCTYVHLLLLYTFTPLHSALYTFAQCTFAPSVHCVKVHCVKVHCAKVHCAKVYSALCKGVKVQRCIVYHVLHQRLSPCKEGVLGAKKAYRSETSLSALTCTCCHILHSAGAESYIVLSLSRHLYTFAQCTIHNACNLCTPKVSNKLLIYQGVNQPLDNVKAAAKTQPLCKGTKVHCVPCIETFARAEKMPLHSVKPIVDTPRCKSAPGQCERISPYVQQVQRLCVQSHSLCECESSCKDSAPEKDSAPAKKVDKVQKKCMYVKTKKKNYDRFKVQWVSKGCIDAQLSQSICTNKCRTHKEDTGEAVIAYITALSLSIHRGCIATFAPTVYRRCKDVRDSKPLRVHRGKVSAIKQLTVNSIRRSILTTRSYIFDAPPSPSTADLFSLTTKTNKIEKKRLQRLTQIAYYQSGKIVVQTLLPLHPPVALITLNLSGTTIATSADTYIPIDDELNTYWCSFLESRLMGLYGGKASSLLLNRQHLLSIFSEKQKSKDDTRPSEKPNKDSCLSCCHTPLVSNALHSAHERRCNLFQSNIGIEEIQRATFLAVAMVNRWALSYSCTFGSDCGVITSSMLLQEAAQSNSSSLPNGKKTKIGDNSKAPYSQLDWASKALHQRCKEWGNEVGDYQKFKNRKEFTRVPSVSLCTKDTNLMNNLLSTFGTQYKLTKQAPNTVVDKNNQCQLFSRDSYAWVGKVMRMSEKSKRFVSSVTTSLISKTDAKNCIYLNGVNSSLLYSPGKFSIDNVAITIPLRTHVFQLVNPLQFSISQRDRFYPGWFRLYLPDIEATEFMKNVANYYYSQGLQTLTRSSSIFEKTGDVDTESPVFLVSSFSKKKRIKKLPYNLTRNALHSAGAESYMVKSLSIYHGCIYTPGVKQIVDTPRCKSAPGQCERLSPHVQQVQKLCMVHGAWCIDSAPMQRCKDAKMQRCKDAKEPESANKLGAVSAELHKKIISDRRNKAPLDKSFRSLPYSNKNTPIIFSCAPSVQTRQKNLETISSFGCTPSALQKLPFDYNDIFFLDNELIYHSLVSNCFSKAFFLIDKNRQLIDYFADYLVRFQILRQHQILYLFSTVLFNCKKPN